MNLKMHPDRLAEEYSNATGIYVRAQAPDGTWHSADIYQLDKDSLFHFLRSRGGDNPWAENCIGLMLGHGHFDHDGRPPEDKLRDAYHMTEKAAAYKASVLREAYQAGLSYTKIASIMNVTEAAIRQWVFRHKKGWSNTKDKR